jgi:Flp pilus assembly protein TadD
MSLIYSALASLDNKNGAEVTQNGERLSRRVFSPDKKSSFRWFYFVGVILLTIAGTVFLSRLSAMQEVPQTVASQEKLSQTAQPAQPAVTLAPVDAQQLPLPVDQEAVPIQQTVVASAEAVTASAKNETVSTPQPTTENRSGYQSIIVHPVASKSVNETSTSGDTEKLIIVARQAIEAGNHALATTTIAQLTKIFPPESITLLRLRAWQALRNNEQALAITLYGQLVERLPDDESSAINLAVLNSKAGNRDEARRIINRLAEHHPDSEVVQSYLAKF